MADGNPFSSGATANPYVAFLTAFNNPTGGPAGQQGSQSGNQQGTIGQVVKALLAQRAQKAPGVAPSPASPYEGNIATQANPYTGGGQYGMPGGGDMWSQGTAPVPYADPAMQALFSQPPTS